MESIKRALISVSDKSKVTEFARQLQTTYGVEILSTGGTAALLQEHHIKVIEVSDYTQFPEMMGGRIKSLHPKIHGGILGRREADAPIMAEYGIKPIDLVVVNLYPFEQTIANPKSSLPTIIENIDIGGPALLRAAAKNYESVVVVTDPTDYELILAEIKINNGFISPATRFELAVKSFKHTAAYDTVIANYLEKLSLKDKK